MAGKSFAFQVATPLESAVGEQEVLGGQYDPQSQTLQWQGEARAKAYYHCTRVSHAGPRYCNAYGWYCNTYGSRASYTYNCDL